MKAVLYCRVSSKEQEEDGFSLDAQEKAGLEYATRRGFAVVRQWKVSESAWSKGRNQFNLMVEFLKRNDDVPHIIFDCLDRMTRNDFDKLKMGELVKDHGKTIHFARTGKIISSSSGSDDEFLFDIEVAVAKKWSNDISRKASMGMKEKAEQGFYPGKAPLGYLNDVVTRTVLVDHERADLVSKAFELMASGQYSLSTLTTELSRLGLRTRSGKKLQKSSVEQMMKNPFYTGNFRWKGEVMHGDHQPLISVDLFEAVADSLAGRYVSKKPRRNGFPLNNLAECGICGCRVIGERKKGRYVYYHCTYSKGRHPGVSYLQEGAMLEMFGESVKRATISDDVFGWLREVLLDSRKSHSKNVEKRLGLLYREKSQLETRLSKLYDCLCDGTISAEAFSRKESEYKSQLARTTAATRDSEKEVTLELADGLKILELANRLYPTYLDMSLERRAKLLGLIASNYRLEGQSISATYRKPFSLLGNLMPRPIKLPRLDSNQRPAD